MNSALSQKYHGSLLETLATFEIKLSGVSERLHRERAAWGEEAVLEDLDRDRFVLIVRAGGAQRLSA